MPLELKVRIDSTHLFPCQCINSRRPADLSLVVVRLRPNMGTQWLVMGHFVIPNERSEEGSCCGSKIPPYGRNDKFKLTHYPMVCPWRERVFLML